MSRGPLAGGIGGLGGPVPRDVIVLLAVLLATLAIDVLTANGLELLRLTSASWAAGYVWQLATYAFIGYGPPSLWFLLALFILFLFGKDVFWNVGRKRFWRTIAWAVVGAGLVAAVVDLVGWLLGFRFTALYPIMQGERVLITILIAAFATVFRDATVYLLFVLPLRASWFLWIEILFAFIAFLSSAADGRPDLPGFLGICAAVGITFTVLRHGGPGRGLRRAWLRVRQRQLQHRLERERRKRGFKVVRGGDDGPWLN